MRTKDETTPFTTKKINMKTLKFLIISTSIVYLFASFTTILLCQIDSQAYIETNTIQKEDGTNIIQKKLVLKAKKTLNIETDEINLQAGWNLISLDVVPENQSIKSVFSNLKKDNLEMVVGFDEENKTYNATIPTFLNDLNEIEKGKGYWVKVREADLLVVEGEKILDKYRSALKTGWNLISFIPEESSTIEKHLNDLIESENLQIATGFNGINLTYQPSETNENNSLRKMENGEGYWLRVNKTTEEYNPCIDINSARVRIDTCTNHPILLAAPNGFDYYWSYEDLNSTNQSIPANNSGTYTLELIGEPCSQEILFDVIINQPVTSISSPLNLQYTKIPIPNCNNTPCNICNKCN